MTPPMSANTREFEDAWKAVYSWARPYTWELRERCQLCWTRFYMLPEGKRPIETADERVMALERARRIVNATFDQDAFVTLVIGEPRRSDLPSHFLSLEPTPLTPWATQGEEEADRPPLLWLARTRLDDPGLGGSFEVALRGGVGSFLILGSSLPGSMIGLYEGGIDTFVPSTPLRRDLRQWFREWRSERPDGL